MAVAAVVAATRVEAAVVVVATMVIVLVSPLTLYRPSTTVLIHFVFKLIFPENKKNFKKVHNSECIGESTLALTRRCRIIRNIFPINYS